MQYSSAELSAARMYTYPKQKTDYNPRLASTVIVCKYGGSCVASLVKIDEGIDAYNLPYLENLTRGHSRHPVYCLRPFIWYAKSCAGF